MQRKICTVFISLLIIVLINSIFTNCLSATSVKQKNAIIITLDQINIEDLNGDYPNIHKLINKGALGLMNIRTSGSYKPASGYLTIGAGTRGLIPRAGDMIFEAQEKYEGYSAIQVFENYTGIRGKDSNIFVLNIAEIISVNLKRDFKIIPGLLGDTLKNNQIPVSILGNADTSTSKDRLAALIAMDKEGIVNGGHIGSEVLIETLQAPFFLQSDYEAMYEKYQQHIKTGGLLLMHLGDTVRADKYSDYVTEERYQFLRKKALQNADRFLGKIIKNFDFERDLLMLVTPFPSQNGYSQKNLLTPFVMYSPNIQQGLAISATTRRPGIVANIDIAPTILSFYEIPVPTVMLGHDIESVKKDASFAYLTELNKQLISTYKQRAYLIKPYVGLQIIVSLSFLLLVLLRKDWLKYMKPVILAGIIIPWIFLFLTEIATNSLWSKYFWLCVLIIILVTLVNNWENTSNKIIFICLLTALSILGDLALGSPLMKASVLGYDPIGGSRYYGLGNEYMGVLIGSLIIGLMVLLDKAKSREKLIYLVYIIFAITFYLILSPQYGSNVGGTISAFGAFLITIFLIKGINLKLKHIIFSVGGLILALLILFLLIAPQSTPSHISQTAEVVKEGGLEAVILIIGRKLAMNYKLFKYTVWTRGLLTFLIVILALVYKPPYILKRVFFKYKYLYSGIIGTGVGCILALCVNDSGIVAAATMMIYITLPILLLVIDEL